MSGIEVPETLDILISKTVVLPTNRFTMEVTKANMNAVLAEMNKKALTVHKPLMGILNVNSNGERYDVGILIAVVCYHESNWPRISYTITFDTISRFKVVSIIQVSPIIVARVEAIPSFDRTLPGSEATIQKFEHFKKAFISSLNDAYVRIDSRIHNKIKVILKATHSMNDEDFVDAVCQFTLPPIDKLKVLHAVEFHERLDILVDGFKKYAGRTMEPRDNRDYLSHTGSVVRNPAHIQKPNKELGLFSELAKKLTEIGIPPKFLKKVNMDLERVRYLDQSSYEYSMMLSYLELVAELPWSTTVEETCNIQKARADLDADHYGLDKVKKRIVEFLAVRKLKKDLKGPILCLKGPPGVGKTSIACSIANTLGRPFHKISVGGISDAHAIRGHRRTYIGAMPGIIIHGLKTVKAKNPVFLIDEVDKLSKSHLGDPASALLEVLDPEQNDSFFDTYLNFPFDLSQVLFIATANRTSTIPSPLLDRMEIIDVPGYTQEEKVRIAELHLIKKEIVQNGLEEFESLIKFPTDKICDIIRLYTFEAGVRSLQRNIGALCRAIAVDYSDLLETTSMNTPGDKSLSTDNKDMQDAVIATENFQETIIDDDMIFRVLGPVIYPEEHLAGRLGILGVCVGLSCSLAGGDVMLVEAKFTDGDGKLNLTGLLGDVMQESVQIALSWVLSHASELGVMADFMKNNDLHLHFPAGAISKDGPSAGVAILCAIVSLVLGIVLRQDVAMTGEVTLNGVILPVGGIRDKIMAAHRCGLTTVIIPASNKQDLACISQSILESIEVILVNNVKDVLDVAFVEKPYALQEDIVQSLPSKL